jgi:foldase protein PrsA
MLTWLLTGCGKTAAIVNGHKIYQSEIDKQIDLIKNQQPKAFEGEKGKSLEKNFRERILDSLITAELIREEAKKAKIKSTNKEIDKKISQVKNIFSNDEKKFEEALKRQGLTLAEYRKKVGDQIILEKMVSKITANIKISDKKVREFYDKNKSQFVDPEQYHLRQIFLKDKKKADSTLKEIKEGADFVEKAKALSEDPTTKDSGGDLGFRPINQFPQQVSSIIKKLSIGEVSDVVDMQGNYYIYRLEEKKPSRQKSFEEVKSQIKQRLQVEEKRNKFLKWVEELKKKAKISRNA